MSVDSFSLLHFLHRKTCKRSNRGRQCKVFSFQNLRMRLFPKSTTTMTPSGVTATPEGRSICPKPLPCVPNLHKKFPFGSNTWTLWLRESATMMRFSWSTATPWGRRNCPFPVPSEPRKRADWQSGRMTRSRWLLKSVTTRWSS